MIECPHCHLMIESIEFIEQGHVNCPRINAGASGFTEGTTSTVLHQLEIG